ncbi:MAG: DsrE family protein [Acidimicrobiales bacterium]
MGRSAVARNGPAVHGGAVKVLLVLNDPAYGTERSYNGLRVAGALSKREGNEVRVFLMGDAVTCAMAGQKVPDGYYRLDRMIEVVSRHGGKVACCGTCLDARGIGSEFLVTEAFRSTLDQLAEWSEWADKVITF